MLTRGLCFCDPAIKHCTPLLYMNGFSKTNSIKAVEHSRKHPMGLKVQDRVLIFDMHQRCLEVCRMGVVYTISLRHTVSGSGDGRQVYARDGVRVFDEWQP